MKISKVSCGSNFTMALIEGKSPEELNMLYSWGNNDHGQLGLDIETMNEGLPCRVTAFEE
jgi:alpha-tubulin suppressor-like RCC1 family protein